MEITNTQRWVEMQQLAQTGLYTAAEIAVLVGTTRNVVYKNCSGLPYRIERPKKFFDDSEHDPVPTSDFYPTDAPPGSKEKIEIMRKRIELGQPLRHEHDRVDFSGITCGTPESNYSYNAAGPEGNIRICKMPMYDGKTIA